MNKLTLAFLRLLRASGINNHTKYKPVDQALQRGVADPRRRQRRWLGLRGAGISGTHKAVARLEAGAPGENKPDEFKLIRQSPLGEGAGGRQAMNPFLATAKGPFSWCGDMPKGLSGASRSLAPLPETL